MATPATRPIADSRPSKGRKQGTSRSVSCRETRASTESLLSCGATAV